MGPNCGGTKDLARRDRHPYQPRLGLAELKSACAWRRVAACPAANAVPMTGSMEVKV